MLKTLTWNIGGGKLLTPGADPSLIASYGRDGLEEISRVIRESAADIVALQEVQQLNGKSQIDAIATLAGYEHYFYDVTSESHIDSGHQLGHGILSKHPITNHTFGLFNNPKIRIGWEDGSIATSFDKGFSSCEVDIDGHKVSVTSLHLIPFRRFDISLDSQLAKEILDDVSAKLSISTDKAIIMGDFNINDSYLATYLPALFTKYSLEEININEPTTPKGRSYDHVLFRGLEYKSKQIDSHVLTDHYPVICDFILKSSLESHE
ncbi:MAG: endonuclease/exonuclease/phosphatase family protein [Candidatus Saccharimonas aalborgensis]